MSAPGGGTASMVQAGERLLVECRLPWLGALLREACGAALVPGPVEDPDVHLVVGAERQPFDTTGWDPLTRGAYQRNGAVVLTNACGSGFDLRVQVAAYQPHAKVTVEARFRPPARERAATYAMRSRFHLLARAALVQYPALWAAGTRGRAVLHAAAVQAGDRVALLAGPGGIGRSTVLLQAIADGGRACSDNLCVSDGEHVHGLVEPVRIEGAGGRRMPHGRGETQLPGRVGQLTPDRVVVLTRHVTGSATTVRPLSAERARRALCAGTYMAGELNRYWGFAAALAAGTGRGPVHPAVPEVARALCRLPAVEICLGARPVPALVQLLVEPTAVAS